MRRPELAAIRQAAHSRARAADAVFGAFLCRVAVLVPPQLMLPPIVGSVATLDLLVANVGSSGAGKSSSSAVAAELVPIDDDHVVLDLAVGSGEGLVDAYLGTVDEIDDNGKKIRVRRQVRRAVHVLVDEGQVLAELTARRGATIMPTLRSAWSGATLGQANASVDTHRRVNAGSYRLAATIGIQPEHAVALLDDTAGTAQRLLWLSATDPDIPDHPPAWPGYIDLTTPDPHRYGIACTMKVDDTIATEIRTAALARARGQVVLDPLDAHADLLRLKVAALLGIIDARTDVNPDDWQLAGLVMRTSRAVRNQVRTHAIREARRREDAANDRAVRRDAVLAGSAEDRARNNMAKAMARHVHKRACGEHCTRRCLSRATAGRDRDHATIEDAIDHAVSMRWITASESTYGPGEARPA
jgi:hypothetical protein